LRITILVVNGWYCTESDFNVFRFSCCDEEPVF
jgi:hypothetical protein